jgi:hypothetical protein
MMAEDATPLIEALLAIIDAARAYLPPDGIDKDAFITNTMSGRSRDSCDESIRSGRARLAA